MCNLQFREQIIIIDPFILRCINLNETSWKKALSTSDDSEVGLKAREKQYIEIIQYPALVTCLSYLVLFPTTPTKKMTI